MNWCCSYSLYLSTDLIKQLYPTIRQINYTFKRLKNKSTLYLPIYLTLPVPFIVLSRSKWPSCISLLPNGLPSAFTAVLVCYWCSFCCCVWVKYFSCLLLEDILCRYRILGWRLSCALNTLKCVCITFWLPWFLWEVWSHIYLSSPVSFMSLLYSGCFQIFSFYCCFPE